VSTGKGCRSGFVGAIWEDMFFVCWLCAVYEVGEKVRMSEVLTYIRYAMSLTHLYHLTRG
jgi:hypothetical protein